jgi:signal transduction histidine kinase
MDSAKSLHLSVTETDQKQLIRKLARLVEISLVLNSTLELETLLQFILDSAVELLACEAASILLYDEQRGELFFTAATGTDPKKLAEIPVPLDASIAGKIFLQNQLLVINDVEKDPLHYATVGEQTKFQPRSLLGVPMCIRDRVTGVLEALNKQQGQFNEMDQRILSVVASQAAVAIHNAQLVQALQGANAELSRVDKIKSDFMAIAAHELRTPLGVILGYASFLKDEAHGDLSEHASMVLGSAQRLKSVVEAMTNMDLLQLGIASLEKQLVPLRQIVETAWEEVVLLAEARRQQVVIQLCDGQPLVDGDDEKLKLVFKNLFNNAVRFTPEGGHIWICLAHDKANARITVKDDGIGIPKDELENVFKEFYQVEHHMTRRHEGLGLGLAIARGIIQLHGGKIYAESEGSSRGSIFTVMLPVL